MPVVTRPPQGRSFWRFIHDRNPFYLLSAVSMFAGCRAIISAVGVAPGDGGTLVALVAALQAYEMLLVGLALFLIRRRGLGRDGWILLGIESLFLVDLTLLTGEIFSADLRLGLLVNEGCFLLAIAKIGAVVRVLRLRVPAAVLVTIGVQLAAMFGVTGVFKAIARDGAVPPLMLYGAWWVVAAMPALWAAALGRRENRPAGSSANPFEPLPYRLYAFMGFVSLVVHVSGMHRVYGVPFHAAHAAPVLIGLAILIGRWAPVAHLSALLAGVAVLMSLRFPAELAGDVHGVGVTPLRCALVGTAVVALCALWRYRRLVLASVATACLVTAALGRDVPEMRRHLVAVVRWLAESARLMMPATPFGWGVAAVVASFVLLGVGALISLGKSADVRSTVDPG